MAKTKTIRVTDAELALLQQMRTEQENAEGVIEVDQTKEDIAGEANQALVNAFVSAIERTRPVEKKTVFSRKSKTPWSPPDGVPRTKFKHKFYQHGILIGEQVTNEDIELMNKIKPGLYCDGWVRVNLRKDKGLDIDYPVRTSSQRLKLTNTYGIRSFTELLQRVVDEKTNPAKYRKAEDADLYDIDQ